MRSPGRGDAAALWHHRAVRRVLVITAVAMVSGNGCRSSAPAPAAPLHHSEVHVDRRVELISIVERLAGAPPYTAAASTPYVADVDRSFGSLADDPAVAATRALIEHHGISFDAPMDLAVHLDDKLALRGPLTDERWRGIDIAGYVAKLQAFAARGQLDAFLAGHGAYFAAVEARLRSEIEREDPQSWFDALFGPRAGARTIVVPGLLEGPNNYGVRFEARDGALEMYQVIGLAEPDAQGLVTLTEPVLELLVHEMAHSYINPMFATRRDALEAAGKAVFALVEPAMRRQSYTTWNVMLNEAGVRAVTALYVRDRKGASAATTTTREQVRLGFVWTAELTDLLAGYERGRHGDLAAFMPELEAWLGALAARYAAHGIPQPGFLGPIDAAIQPDATFVVPAADGPLARYVRAVHDRLFAGAPLASELPAHGHAIAYGTPASPPIAATAARAGWRISSDGIELGSQRFSGSGLVLVACWPRDGDPQHGVVVYAAGDEADLVGINSVRHGSTDWLVARRTGNGFEPIASGNFPRAADGSWQLP